MKIPYIDSCPTYQMENLSINNYNSLIRIVALQSIVPIMMPSKWELALWTKHLQQLWPIQIVNKVIAIKTYFNRSRRNSHIRPRLTNSNVLLSLFRPAKQSSTPAWEEATLLPHLRRAINNNNNSSQPLATVKCSFPRSIILITIWLQAALLVQ